MNISFNGFEETMHMSVGGNTVEQYLVALAVFFVSVAILRIFKFVIINSLKSYASRTKNDIDDLFVRSLDVIGWLFYGILAFHISIQFLAVPDVIRTISEFSLLIAGTYYAVRIIHQIIDYVKQKLIAERMHQSEDADTSVIDLLATIIKYILWLIAALLILSNVGYDITPMIAGLGIGGIAIAFALQNVLTDVFASFSIYFDKPFRKGDFIIVGTDMGEVKRVGIKSTRIQALQGQEIIISNKELTEARVHNYKRMYKRRIVFGFGVVYDTSLAKLQDIIRIVTDIIKKEQLADLDRVHFKAFGPSSLDFEVVYFVKTSDFNKYMDTQQNINFAIKERFEKEGIEMAYPTQTLYVNAPSLEKITEKGKRKK